MSDARADSTRWAYRHRLLVKSLLEEGVARAPQQEIVYGTKRRLTYRELRERVGRLASGLGALGVEAGDTVAVMDWDSHRYLECFFAVPMMGAVLHTINVRLSPAVGIAARATGSVRAGALKEQERS